MENMWGVASYPGSLGAAQFKEPGYEANVEGCTYMYGIWLRVLSKSQPMGEDLGVYSYNPLCFGYDCQIAAVPHGEPV